MHLPVSILLLTLPEFAQLSAGMAADILDSVPVLLGLESHGQGLQGQHLSQHGVTGSAVQGTALGVDTGKQESVGVLSQPAVGIADDLIGVRYRAKFFIQIVCGIMLVAGGVELSDLHGMLFIHSMPSWISIPLTVFVTVFIINAINLIDGIDGLASGLCSIAFLFYGMTFIWFHQYLYAMLAFATLGVLIPFYYYPKIRKQSQWQSQLQ